MMFWDLNKNYSSNIACIDEESDQKLTYSELFTIVYEIEKNLSTSSKSLVLILTDNSVITLLLYLAALRADLAIMLLDANVERDLLNLILKDYEVSFILSPKPINKSIDGTEEINILNLRYYKQIVYPSQEISVFNDLALMLSTSGSTGSSKFVKLTKLNLHANARSIVNYLNITQDQIAITTLPMHYSFGLSIINTHLLAGATLVLTNKSVVQKEFWEVFKKNNCTTFSGVPYTFQMLQKLRFHKIELQSLQYFTQAGGHLNSESKKYFLEYAIKNHKEFIVMYGQTEATARISYVPFKNLKNKIESIGIPIPGGKIRLYDGEIEIKEPEKTGELVYEGENVMLGYATSRISLSLGDELSGVLRTGDLGKYDCDGFYYVTGRMKRFLKVFGNRVSLDELERMLEVKFSLPFGVTGVDDKVCILGEEDSIEKHVIDFLTKKTGIHFSAFIYGVTQRLPVSTNSKKDYGVIREMFGL